MWFSFMGLVVFCRCLEDSLLNFWYFNYNTVCPGVGFFGFILLGFSELLGPGCLFPSPGNESFEPLVFQITSLSLSLSSPSGIPNENVSALDIVPEVP